MQFESARGHNGKTADFAAFDKLQQEYVHTVAAGETLSAIALAMLNSRGETASPRNIYDEVERIAELNNRKYPWITKNPAKIRPGMQVTVWNRERGPEPSCRWQPWIEAEPGKLTVAQRCQSVFAGKDSRVIVAPGARAVFAPGSSGFVAPGGEARALTIPEDNDPDSAANIKPPVSDAH